MVDEDAALDSGDRSFPAFWLPFQDVNSHNHSAQWVERIVGKQPMPDGGTPPPADAGAAPDAAADSGPMCAGVDMACSLGCCPDVVCCHGTCQPFCLL